jgi:hypothetical protein
MSEDTTTTTREELAQPFVIQDDSGDFIEYACQHCAEKFAADNGLTWNSSRSGTELHKSGLSAYDTLWDRGETDYPVACACGQYLDVSLTRDGVEYMTERDDFPAWLYLAHGINHAYYTSTFGTLVLCRVCGHLCEDDDE